MAAQSKQEVMNRRGDDPAVRYGRKLNNRGRAVLADALERVISGDASKWVGEHGRTFPDELAMQLINDPFGSLLKINAATPSDEGDGKGEATSNVNIQALYLAAVQVANKPELEPRVIEATAQEW